MVAYRIVVYGAEIGKSHFPLAHVVCGEVCRVKCERSLNGTVKRMAWPAFLEALTMEGGDEWSTRTISTTPKIPAVPASIVRCNGWTGR